MAEKELDLIIELQSLAQAGLFYSKDPFDQERFERIRTLSFELMTAKTELPYETVKAHFGLEAGYQTPKLDTRAALFKEDKILLVQENDGRWSLPGGWVDVMCSVGESAVKEVKEEAGLDAAVVKLIAIQDRDRHNLPRYAYKVCKVFVLCESRGGAFAANTETIAADYFSLTALPELATAKNTKEQIALCFEAYRSADWQPIVE